MANKFVLNSNGVQQLLKSAEMQSICREHAEQIRARAGDGFAVSTYVGKTRCNASVYPETDEARWRNYNGNTLLKAVQK